MQLFLTLPESKLRVKDGLFEVSYFDASGNPQKAQHAPSMLGSIWLHEGATITVAAIRLAMSNQIDLVICDWHGDPEGRLSALRPSTTSLVQKAQAMVSVTPRGLMYARDWAALKLEYMADLLERLAGRRGSDQEKALAEPVRRIRKGAGQMRALVMDAPHSPTPHELGGTLRGLEGSASKVFFGVLSGLLPAQYRFAERSRRPAKDAFNAFLNYGFAVLYRKIERALVRAGLNMYIGFLHRDGHQFKSLVFDFIEPFRVEMIQAIFGLFSKKQVNLALHIRANAENSGVTLTKEGKTLLLERLNRFYEKKGSWQGISMMRERILEKEAVQFAQSLLSLIGEPEKQLEGLEAFSPN